MKQIIKLALYKVGVIANIIREKRPRQAMIVFIQMLKRPLLELRAILGLGSSPDFLIIGAQKAGTTWLYSVMQNHPSVLSGHKKEIRYFDRLYKIKSVKWYKAFFTIFKRKGRVTGEATPDYLFHPLVPERVYGLFPDIKIIALLRNPVDRAYSHYQMHQRRKKGKKAGRESMTFGEAIEQEGQRTVGEYDKVKSGLNSLSWLLYSYKARGRYAEQLARWYKCFDKKQILVLKTESLRNNPRDELTKVFNFIGLSLPKDMSLKTKREGTQGRIYSKMDQRVRVKLEEYFRPYNQQLYEMMGRDFNWEADNK